MDRNKSNGILCRIWHMDGAIVLGDQDIVITLSAGSHNVGVCVLCSLKGFHQGAKSIRQ